MAGKIKNALISLSDKGNLYNILFILKKNNINVISSGGTYKSIKKLGFKCQEVSEFTGFNEILNGRVKTLHPKIHSGILFKRSESKHRKQMRVRKFEPIDLVIVNFYPFESTIKKTSNKKRIIENIDIGGPSMVRSAAKNFNGDGILQLNEWFMRTGVVVLATPEVAGLPYVISGLVAAGGMAAAMSTADGLILAIANALSHDVYYNMIDPKADVRKRLIVARVLLIVIGAAGAYIASMRITSILGAVAWAFDFAMSGLFFPLVLGVWWKRATREGAIAGMLSGLAAGTMYLIWVYPKFMGNPAWLGIDHLRFGLIGAPVCLVVMVVVSLMTKAPDAATQRMVDEVRVPSGKSILGRAH